MKRLTVDQKSSRAFVHLPTVLDDVHIHTHTDTKAHLKLYSLSFSLCFSQFMRHLHLLVIGVSDICSFCGLESAMIHICLYYSDK